LLRTKSLSKSYGNRTITFPDLELNQGEHQLVIGQSGSGKTTLLNIIGGLLSPDKGSVCIGQKVIYDLSNRELDFFRGESIGFVFQTPQFVRSFNVEDNLLLNQYLAGTINNQQIDKFLGKVGLLDRKKAKIHDLSEGEKQRIGIVRGLLNNPKLILADEPTSALDDKSCENIIKLLIELSIDTKAILLIVTHDQRLKDRFPEQITLHVN